MKNLLVIAALLLSQVAPAQDSIPPKKRKIEVVKPYYTKKEKKQHAIGALTIVAVFVSYMCVLLLQNDKK